MPRASLTESYRTGQQVDQFASLTLKTGEFARLLIPGNRDDVWYEWVHAFRAPYFDDETGKPAMEQKKRKDGSVYKEVYATSFVGGQICLGDPSVIEGSGNGLDPARCPACASAAKGTRGMAPDRRWAVPVIRYKCVSRGSTELQTPPTAEILVWSMTQKQFNSLLDVRPEIRNLFDLPPDQDFEWRIADVVVWCEDENFKRHLFKSPLRPAYGKNAPQGGKVAELVRDLWGTVANRPTDAQLRAACGREPDREFMTTDVETVEAAWRKVDRYEAGDQVVDPIGSGPVSGNDAKSLDEDLTGLLEDHPGGLAEFAAKPAAVDDPFAEDAAPAPAAASVDDPFAEAPAQAATGQPGAQQDAADPFGDPVPAAAGASPKATQSFEDLMKIED
jgi:hypothetical protein